ncbi:23S rRNA (guanosine(2251)-2'-O)-methyltransferase RlmB [Ochrobactrum quorumnocens]|jgi:23S rRNA (guanosine2251-2'-O)-methyltransferase|uniref:23S rRNA (Guanosine(2251)-2'-O)-methyltransferase RlmB n=1 Tax=Ochrobactrum quorumnocens TaxID=271865 RepID=A0A248UGR4_9HYPH|nr:23S rRNA (guanosine(2251)-2'-O)-methyltransferase RlmB [[Ochrobactrum] quorumnocens]ASV85868.1 RNA 2'-O ribose methyltransferase substrate binding family protein [[Ochrobactrum] quorumnocens]KAA9367691.1 23S rRNA (guanosine(2251)-2'-O)-methyltransferase RlmB [[Ochrobactrum] quorumnocens]MBD7989999.1 23S rRNA (guanosine(2251)-2'-O)-methyltransferase RlmB [Ochrobactrum gallinarum]
MNDQNSPRTPKDSHYARLRREHRDHKAVQEGKAPHKPQRAPIPASRVAEGTVRLYGLHTVRAAVENPARNILRMRATRNGFARLEIGEAETLPFPVEIVEPKDIDKETGSDAVHQGVMIEAQPLRPKKLSELKESPLLLVLDQVTDPHNVGAIIRSAVAFGAGALITTSRHSPQESGVLAKAASGALELIPHIEVRNLADAIEELHSLGFMTIGLDSEGPQEMESTLSGDRVALVLGAEGKGLRQKTRETVSALARLDMPGEIKSLNVSNAAAVSLYAAERYLRARRPS